MASSAYKHYSDEGLCSKELVEAHISQPHVPGVEDCLGFPLRILHDLFCKGKVTAEKVLDFSLGSSLYQLFSVSSVCKQIYVLRLKDNSIEHVNKWMDKEHQAIDWSYATRRVCHLEGNKKGWQEKEEQLRKAIVGVYKWENYETSDIDPSLVPKVDCVVSLWMLNFISKTKEEFQKYVKAITCRLKCGGHLVLFGVVNMSYYQVGKQRYSCLKLEETEMQEMVVKQGFVIEKSSIIAKGEAHVLADYSHKCFILARKEREA